MNEWKSDKVTSLITIEGNVEPYKLEVCGSLDDWEWDSFNFETGIIRQWKDLTVEDSLTITVVGTRKTVVPSFIVQSNDGSGMTVTFDGRTYNLSDGVNRVVNINIKQETQTLVFTGNGTVSIDYRGGRL